MIALKKKNSNNTMPRKITSVAKNISDLSDHFSLKRISNNNSSVDLPNSKTTPSLWSSSNSSSITVQDDDEDPQNQHSTVLLPHSNSTLDICTVPRTGSFVIELNKRLEISEKKDEPVSQIIPPNNHITTKISSTASAMRKSAPVLHISNDNLDSSSMFVLPPLPNNNNKFHQNAAIAKNRKSVPTSTSSPSLNVPPPPMKRSTTGTSVHSIASSSNSSISTNQSSVSNNKRNNWHFSQWFSHPPLPSSMVTTSSSTLPIVLIEPHQQQQTKKYSLVKRERVIQELLQTEKSYKADMELIKEIYYDFAYEAFSKLEIKQIFINLLDIIAFEKDFISLLEHSNDEAEEENEKVKTSNIGTAFSIMVIL